MKKYAAILILAASAQAGTLKVASFPVRHPVKTAKTLLFPVAHPVKTVKAVSPIQPRW